MEADAASAGVATASGIAAAIWNAGGVSDGAGVATVVGAALWLSNAATSGIATLSGEANALWVSVGSAAGSAAVTGEIENVGAGEPVPAAPAQAFGGRSRRRYILPDDVVVLATEDEIQAILEEFVVVEQPKPKTKKQKRKAKHEPFVPIEIHFEPLPDFQVQTFRPVLPPVMVWRPDLEALQRRIQQLKRRIDDEEAILLLL